VSARNAIAPKGPVITDARYIATSTSIDGLPPPAFAEVAFAGRSNVGKSSLINCLVERNKLVRTSNTPGQTRGISIFRVDLKGAGGERASVDFVDLPGYGYAKRSKGERKSWGPMIEGFLEGRVGLCAVVVIIDARRGLEDTDEQLLEYLAHIGRPAVIVATKIDKLTKAERAPHLAQIAARAGTKPYAASSETREGREAIFERVLDLAGIAR
jgi:GTP-binding protein